jgi:hypothetical protein
MRHNVGNMNDDLSWPVSVPQTGDTSGWTIVEAIRFESVGDLLQSLRVLLVIVKMGRHSERLTFCRAATL